MTKPVPQNAAGRIEGLDRIFRRMGLCAVVLDESIDAGAVLGSRDRGLRGLVLSEPVKEAIDAARWTLGRHSGQVVELLSGVSAVGLRPSGKRGGALAVIFPTAGVFENPNLAGVIEEYDGVMPGWVLGAGETGRLIEALTAIDEARVMAVRQTGELYALTEELGTCYEELSLLYKFSSSMTVNQPTEAFFESACVELRQVLGLRWLALCLLPQNSRRRGPEVYGAGDLPGETTAIGELAVGWLSERGSPEGPCVLGRTESHLASLASQVLVVPLRKDGRLLGLLIGGEKLDGSKTTSVDAKLCDALASSLSIFRENLTLYDDMQRMFMGTLHALTSAIDAKDSYTHGHTERVAALTRDLAMAARLDSATVERVYLCGLVHDVGKIGVPERVLTKPGKLTEEEYRQIKLHPEIGARIIEDIPQMEDLIPGVLHHHERWDGQGYPGKLVGSDIPLFGRLVALADSFDAMSSNRSYRPSMPHETVLEEIRRCSGTQFDPGLTEIFLGLDFGPFFGLIQQHQQREQLLRSA